MEGMKRVPDSRVKLGVIPAKWRGMNGNMALIPDDCQLVGMGIEDENASGI